MEFNLILSTESKVLSTNISTFQQQAENYLAELSNRFETDDDFAQAKQDIKDLTELEKRTKEAIANAQNGEIKQLIEQAQAIAERFRQARLEREKLVKTKEAEIKASIVNDAFERLAVVKSGFENDVCIALEQVISKATIKKRLDEATKRRSTLATLTKAVNAEETLIGAEIATEAARLSARRKLIPISYEYLFKDWLNLITGDDELEPIIQARIAEEEKREAEIKAKAEQEAKARAEAKLQENAHSQQENINENTANSGPQTPSQATPPATTQFILKIPAQEIPFTGTLEQLREYFAPVKVLGITATIVKK
ncbi:hypothetical protein [Avibacterium paragallinarum]|uniref:Phage-like endonuclease protein n=1 Tax=Avibacterium paragallinarum TaxID=728 RepID=A0A0F5ESE8_AVIPA|nr:hypothetical protein [Avibacterium paragallinarum]KAA6208063.1 hypothetical protein F1968_11345 [Avibacterium paragallinarum]KKA99460.1 hypothetical protein Z012_11975 [Avibacterium paragallinarum]RZN69694.1 hypothetical protein EIG77_09595 [Avibacterium paragallinarum]SUU97113.1 Uncharacterised protein [Avibacterium paragallinarum]